MVSYVSVGLFLAIVLGFVLPVGSMKPMVPLLLGSMLFFSFLKIDYRLSSFLKKELGYWLFAVAFTSAAVFFLTAGLNPLLRLGILLICVSPPAVSSPVVGDLIGADMKLLISNTVLYSLLSPVSYPIFLGLFSEGVSVPAGQIIRQLSLMIFVPMVLAFFVSKKRSFAAKLSSFSNAYNPLALMAVVVIAVSAASSGLSGVSKENLATVFGVIFALAGFNFALGYILPKKTPVKKALSMALGHKNTTLAIYVALTNFPDVVALPAVAYTVCHNFYNAVLVSKFRNRKGAG